MENKYPFEKQQLPYATNALEPFIDAPTMALHHDTLYADYVDNLNGYLDIKPNLQTLSLTELLQQHSDNVTIAHNAGGVFNHEFFFGSMRPGISQIVVGLGGKLLQSINRDFGSLENMKQQFFSAASSIFGSGYAWLCAQQSGKLGIITTINQDTPLALNLKPLLCIDVWEHAYLAQHKTDRDQYISNFWSVIDWLRVTDRLN